ncbi:MAG: hypothetical protein R3C49_11375 [Planctomycetaceae bacterium]
MRHPLHTAIALQAGILLIAGCSAGRHIATPFRTSSSAAVAASGESEYDLDPPGTASSQFVSDPGPPTSARGIAFTQAEDDGAGDENTVRSESEATNAAGIHATQISLTTPVGMRRQLRQSEECAQQGCVSGTRSSVQGDYCPAQQPSIEGRAQVTSFRRPGLLGWLLGCRSRQAAQKQPGCCSTAPNHFRMPSGECGDSCSSGPSTVPSSSPRSTVNRFPNAQTSKDNSNWDENETEPAGHDESTPFNRPMDDPFLENDVIQNPVPQPQAQPVPGAQQNPPLPTYDADPGPQPFPMPIPTQSWAQPQIWPRLTTQPMPQSYATQPAPQPATTWPTSWNRH